MTPNPKSPIRVLYVVQVFYPSQGGGPANSVYWVAKHIDKAKVLPIIVSGDKGLDPSVERDMWASSEAGAVIYVRNRVERMSLRQTWVALKKLPGVDAINLSSLFYPPSLFIGIAARLLGKKILWSTRGEVDGPAFNISGRRKKAIVVSLFKLFFGRRVLFHSTSDSETRNIRKKFGAHARVVEIPNYIELPLEVETAPGNYCLYIGRIHEKKGIEKLLRALLISTGFWASGLHLKIAGVGQRGFEDKIRSLVVELELQDRVEFLGQVVGAAKQELLAAARFTIMPSEAENFGLVVLESLAQNTPVIASTGTPWASLGEEKVGLWVDNSPESLALAIDNMLSLDGDEYKRYRLRAREFVEQRFAIADHIDEWHEAYDLLFDDRDERSTRSA
ncbi:MAG: glycosyltransferase [Blastocatellia bacterium]|nr:glycosyltransferase [Blastocatellia bacterium]